MMLRFATFMLPVEFLIKLPYSTLMSDIAVFQIDCIIGENITGLKCIMVRYSERYHTSRLDLDIRSRGLDSSPDPGHWVVSSNELGHG